MDIVRKWLYMSRSNSAKSLLLIILFFIGAFGAGLTGLKLANEFFPPKPTCANSASCVSDLTQKIENGATGIFLGYTVTPPTIDLLAEKVSPNVLGASAPEGDKHIYVDLAAQTLYAYQGNVKVMQAFISSGKWGKTPVGNFNIWAKFRATRMTGGEGSDYYDLPNVPWVMYFYRDFGLHGAYWHDNFGHTMSHGCVNMRQIDARDLFAWADGPEGSKKGTPVSICNSFTEPNNCTQINPIN
jgi:hypothetical protein